MRLRGTNTADPEPPARPVIVASPIEVQSRLRPLIDEALLRFTGRGLVASSEVVDLLLDMRSQIVLKTGRHVTRRA